VKKADFEYMRKEICTACIVWV